MDDSTLARVEAQRLELERNVAQLRKSLRHWQTLEIDYEGLKEEIQLLPENASFEDCLRAARDFKPELVDDKELQTLFDEKQGPRKRPSQIADLLSKRVDYVTRNVSTVRKQLADAERKRNAVLLAQDPEHQEDAGLPLGEIIEELDEEGKVIASRVQTPGKDAPDLLDVLRKAGVPDIKKSDNDQHTDDQQLNESSNSNITAAKSQSENPVSKPSTTSTDANRVEEISEDDDEDGNGDEMTSRKYLEPQNPNDSEEDAALRQEMLQYGLGEVGAIVAELDLEDAANLSDDEGDEDDYLSDYDEDEDLYSNESEDEKGATKNPVISERYKRQMEALSKKHGITDLKNLGPQPDLPPGVQEQLDKPPAAEAARKAAIAREEASKSAMKSTSSEAPLEEQPKQKKKKVGFATELDIAPEAKMPESSDPIEPQVNPVGDTVIERAASTTSERTKPPAIQPPTATKKPSKFKAARSAAPQTPMFPPPKMDFPSTSTTNSSTPQGPHGVTISHTLVERPATQINAPADPTALDEELHKREVAIEYQKMRNRKIHEQGGYVKGGQMEDYGDEFTPMPVVDEETGKTRKVSRFKAARMKSSN